MKSIKIHISNMHCLNDSAAIKGSAFIIYCITKDICSHKHNNPYIFQNNHIKITYSFAVMLLAITLAGIYYSWACIILPSGASSSLPCGSWCAPAYCASAPLRLYESFVHGEFMYHLKLLGENGTSLRVITFRAIASLKKQKCNQH